jgi:hypothetical protein
MLELVALFRGGGASPLCALRLALMTVEHERRRPPTVAGTCNCRIREQNGVKTTCEEKAMKVWKP